MLLSQLAGLAALRLDEDEERTVTANKQKTLLLCWLAQQERDHRHTVSRELCTATVDTALVQLLIVVVSPSQHLGFVSTIQTMKSFAQPKKKSSAKDIESRQRSSR